MAGVVPAGDGLMPLDFLNSPALRTVVPGVAVLGTLAGGLGAFAVLRKQSLLGDAVSHAALPGIVLAFLVTGGKPPVLLLLGAALAGWAASLVVLAVTRSSRVPSDSALGAVLSVFFGFGVLLLTYAQKHGGGQAGLERFLFGQAATMLASDVWLAAGVAAVALAAAAACWKEFALVSFDPAYAASLGFPVRALDGALTTLVVLATVVGLQAVGVVLMSAMLVAPAAAARQWSDRLGVVVGLSALFGGSTAVAGTLASYALSGPGRPLPTGPCIVLVATVLVVGSLLFGPARGLAWRRAAAA